MAYLVRRLIDGHDAWYGDGWGDAEALIHDLLEGKIDQIVSIATVDLEAPLPHYDWGRPFPEQPSMCRREDRTVAVMRQLVRTATELKIAIPSCLNHLIEATV
jgi:hypothetical protein